LIDLATPHAGWLRGQYGLPAEFRPGDPPELPDGVPHILTSRLEDLPGSECHFYAGVPLTSHDGQAAGMLYLLDRAPRQFSTQDIEALHALGARAVDEVSVRVDRDRMAHELEQAEERDRERIEFVSWTAHELKNPLTVIKSISTLLEADPRFPLQMRAELMRTVSSQADQMLRTLDMALTLARLDSGLPVVLNSRDVDVTACLNAVAKLYTGPKHNIRVIEAPDARIMHADAERLNQILHGLVSNAVKFSPGGGPITITTSGGGGWLQITVEDAGLGIPKGQFDRLFEKYSRLHTGTAPHIKGAGIGLYLCKALVEAHSGAIWAENRDGPGARFHVRIPRQPIGG
jgi:signal transduction histidine kinase